ncbi:MAG: hypothetical protein GY828_01335 [Candidatus Gracilibacteria bacterium]|nr:hypothetical protein [Candidatus Gracilibacteria bacterium]
MKKLENQNFTDVSAVFDNGVDKTAELQDSCDITSMKVCMKFNGIYTEGLKKILNSCFDENEIS